MISRRALRVRVFQFLFSFFMQNSQQSPEILKKQCLQSLNKSYYFYLLMLSLLDELRIIEENDLEKSKNKILKKNQTILPVFTQHPFFLALKESKEFYKKLDEYKVNFGKDKDWINTIYRNLKQTNFYKNYAAQQNHSDKENQYFIDVLISEFLYDNELLEHYFEEASQFAQDDLYLSLNMALKTSEIFFKKNKFQILSQYKQEQSDIQFVENLIQYTIQDYTVFDNYISKYSKNWGLERINYSDLLLIKMCLTELIYMPDVPLKTSVDEYIEISKEYSTPQSYVFINGILVGLISDLTEKGLIKKHN